MTAEPLSPAQSGFPMPDCKPPRYSAREPARLSGRARHNLRWLLSEAICARKVDKLAHVSGSSVLRDRAYGDFVVLCHELEISDFLVYHSDRRVEVCGTAVRFYVSDRTLDRKLKGVNFKTVVNQAEGVIT